MALRQLSRQIRKIAFPLGVCARSTCPPGLDWQLEAWNKINMHSASSQMHRRVSSVPSDLKVQTHLAIDQATCGTPIELSEGKAIVRLTTTELMAADARGLTHGGYYFGMADYAAMLAVNKSNVVLGSAETKFIKPVKTGDSLLAEAVVVSERGKKVVVEVSVKRDDFDEVFAGTFTCFVLPCHVFDA
mmetsp:Transcript_1496/g.3118  ORF Transcript_1496/g.3118 Transcript_1496/m.3118 type:complete len:188 (-) Transcript_1496:547-1110(-)